MKDRNAQSLLKELAALDVRDLKIRRISFRALRGLALDDPITHRKENTLLPTTYAAIRGSSHPTGERRLLSRGAKPGLIAGS